MFKKILMQQNQANFIIIENKLISRLISSYNLYNLFTKLRDQRYVRFSHIMVVISLAFM